MKGKNDTGEEDDQYHLKIPGLPDSRNDDNRYGNSAGVPNAVIVGSNHPENVFSRWNIGKSGHSS